MLREKLESVSINVEDGSIIVNGRELSGISRFELVFDGSWSLTVTETFFPRGKNAASVIADAARAELTESAENR
jgi:hypothetical protein